MRILREILEDAKNKIVELNGKRVCNQTSNSCGCCNWDYSLISLDEKKEIVEFLNKNNEIKQKILKNKLEENVCYFHDKELGECLIYRLRPICCRYISYKIYEKEDCFKTCSPLEPCRKGCSTVIRLEKKDVRVEKYPLRSYQLNSERYYFIDDRMIEEYRDYKNRQNIKLSSVIDEIKK